MKNRIFKNWRTTFLGLMILVLGAYLVITKVTTWESFIISVPAAAAFMYVKDPAKYQP